MPFGVLNDIGTESGMRLTLPSIPGLLVLLLFCNQVPAQWGDQVTFSFPLGDSASSEGQATVVLGATQKVQPTKADDKTIDDPSAINFGGVPTGYIKLRFISLDYSGDYESEIELSFRSSYFSSNGGGKILFPKGTLNLRKGKRPVEVLFGIRKNGTVTISGKFGVITKPNAPPAKIIPVKYTFNVSGISSAPVAPKEDEPKEEEPKELSPEELARLAEESEEAKLRRERDWERATTANSSDAYLDFLNGYKRGPYTDMARDTLSVTGFQSRIEGTVTYKVGFEYAKLNNTPAKKKNIVIERIFSQDTTARSEPDTTWTGDTLLVTLRSLSIHSILVRSPFTRNIEDTISLDPSKATMAVSYEEVNSKEGIKLEFKGGTPPYFLSLVRQDLGAKERIDLPWAIRSTDTVLTKTDLVRALQLAKGNYSLDFFDSDRVRKRGADTILLTPPPLIPRWGWLMMGGVALMFLAGGFYIRRRQIDRDRELAYILEQKKRYETADKIKIVRRRFNRSAEDKLLSPFMAEQRRKVLRGENYEVVMAESFDNSSVSNIFIHKEMVEGIAQYLEDQSPITRARRERDDDVPDIGGFILGQFQFKEETEEYQVSLEQFVTARQDNPDRSQIVFGDESWGELLDAQERYPNLKVIAWFHLHPGHGVYLSLPDQRIQEQHFKEPYQLAMVMDPLKDGGETAFFSQKTNGRLNNARHLTPGASWFNWETLEINKETGTFNTGNE